MSLKIVTPISGAEEFDDLVEAGADEFYCGLLTENTKSKFTNVYSFNVRQVAKANFPTFEELGEVIKRCRSRNIPIHITYNAIYVKNQLQKVLEEIDNVIKLGIDSVMISDVSLIMILKERHPELSIHISASGGTFNSETALFYKDLGAERVILPRHLKLAEIDLLQKNINIPTEIFITSERCIFTNLVCSWDHGQYETNKNLAFRTVELLKRLTNKRFTLLESRTSNPLIERLQERAIKRYGPPCFYDYETTIFDLFGKKTQNAKALCLYNSFEKYRDSCGACSILPLAKMTNIRYVKIVGRNLPTKKKVKDVKLIKGSIEALKFFQKKEDFEIHVKKLREKYYPKMCGREYCYYPE